MEKQKYYLLLRIHTSIRMTTRKPSYFGKYHLLALVISIFYSVNFCAQEVDIQNAIAYIEKAKTFYQEENYEQSMSYFDMAEEIVKELHNDSLLSVIYTRKGHIHLRDGKNKNALTAYSKALDIAELTEHKELEITANSGLIVLLRRMNRLDKALKIAHRSLKLLPNH